MSLNNIEKIKYESNQIKDFKSHIDLESNERILFSGPFGSGKSTFLNEFGETYEDEYKFVKLYPVNYSVSNNEDIFELIKHDVLFELMSKHETLIELQKEDFEFWLKAAMFMQNNLSIMPILLSLISFHDKIGKPVSNFINALKSVQIDYKEFSKSIEVDESKDIFDFLNSFLEKKGGVYEMDATSKFIYDLVNRLKNSSNQSKQNKTVLIIDDLDRLDPDHIFRLFNIFSAHTHSITGENKFGFDKVIFVCDIHNIKKIYIHKYGEGVDFRGYIDKFYSTSPFLFDLNKEIGENVDMILKHLTYSNIDPELQIITRFKNSLTGLIKILVHENLLNLRDIVNVYNEKNIIVNLNQGNRIVTIARILFNLLIKLFGTKEELNSKMLILKQRYSVENPIDSKDLSFHKLTTKEYDDLLETLSLYDLITNEYLSDRFQGKRTVNIGVIFINYECLFAEKSSIYLSNIISTTLMNGMREEIATGYLNLPLLMIKNYEKLKEVNWI